MESLLGKRRHRRPRANNTHPRPCRPCPDGSASFTSRRNVSSGAGPRGGNVCPNQPEHRADTGSAEVPGWKAWVDLALVILILPAALLAALALTCWIALVSPGPVLFRQTRIGRGGKPFTIYKFRTMHSKAETCRHEKHVASLIRSGRPLVKLDRLGDDRLIPGGYLMRMWGLDELPQLINVLRGEMSLVGPRPCLPAEFELFGAHELTRFDVKPGLTGLWQVERSSRTTFNDMLLLDETYARSCSIAGDFLLIARTPVSLVRQFRDTEWQSGDPDCEPDPNAEVASEIPSRGY